MRTRGNTYQFALISLGVASSALFGIFLYQELFPEYKIYQDDYMAIETFRSSYTHEPPPAFHPGIKQIVLERADKGNPVIDRCTSCHVALDLPHFSPTMIGRDVNGNILVDSRGFPKQVPNKDYVWAKIDQKISELEDSKVNEHLKAQGEEAELKNRLEEAQKLKSFKVAHVDEHTFDVTKVLRMHPLIGKETRPFEFHPVEEYGCTSCHNGNGRGLTTMTAHGPVFDDQYEKEFMGHSPHFTEIDEDNDPRFSRVFNGKPGHELLFQTTPIYVGALIQAKCMQCHLGSSQSLLNAVGEAENITAMRKKQSDAVEQGFVNDKKSVLSLLALQQSLSDKGLDETIKNLHASEQNYTLAPVYRQQAASQLLFLSGSQKTNDLSFMENKIEKSLETFVGSKNLVQELSNSLSPLLGKMPLEQTKALDTFLKKYKDNQGATGELFTKLAALNLEEEVKQHIRDVDTSFQATVKDQKAISSIASDIDLLTKNYQKGQELFISQACYACHRIAGMSRGGVGPELTQEGESYPWFVKESVVWPQADLPTSTMPNFVLDHEELEDIVTFLLGQTGGNKAISQTNYKAAIQAWEAGRKLSWEKPISPVQMLDLDYAMTIFATEGCASCHRLKGYTSNVGFKVEKEKTPPFHTLEAEHNWFQALIPEDITGTGLVKVVEKHANEIDQHIAPDVRKEGLLEKINASHPNLIESYYTPFKFAKRAKNAFYANLIAKEKDYDKKKQLIEEHESWKRRIDHLMFLYAQEYGLGRLIGPKPNWSGVFRTDEWLMEHFRNPTSHVPRSIMPIFPFDETKFYALTKMLDSLGIRNRNVTRTLWENEGFNPSKAYEIHCAQCHGEYLQGNGPVSTWIYPIPKNLRNAEFLRNLTRERVIDSITHGVKGTPMPPWGEVSSDKPELGGLPVLTRNEIEKLADWLFSTLPGGTVIKGSEDVPKWHYSPENVLEELRKEGSIEKFKQSANPESQNQNHAKELEALPKGEGLWASLQPEGITPKNDPSTIFDSYSNPGSELEPYHYYIKKKYYTPDNIEKGKEFFELNCAVCHGREGEGAGARAGTMAEAKPRMLTNLDWINTRDDLRLLRSIKFGVAGTAMTPWGDQTSGLQRLQLVMFIRSLSKERSLRDQLAESLYKTFDATDLKLEEVRLGNYHKMLETKGEYQKLQKEREGLYTREIGAMKDTIDLSTLFKKELALQKSLEDLEKKDQQYLQLKTLLKKEKDQYQQGGLELIQNDQQEILSKYTSLIALLAHRIVSKEGLISYHFTEAQEKELSEASDQILEAITHQIISSENPKEKNHLPELQAKINSLKKLKNNLTYTFASTKSLHEEEKQLIEEIKRQSSEKESNHG